MKSLSSIVYAICTFLIMALIGCTEEPAPIAVTSVTLGASYITLVEGETYELVATVSPSNAKNKEVIWTSSNTSVASVKEGLVTAIQAGRTTITVKSDDGGKTATCDVTVSAKIYPVEGVSLDRTSVELTEGDEITLNATVKPDNATNKRVTWSSSDESVAKVVDGKVSTLSPGEVSITVKTEDGSMIATCEVTVKAKVYPVEGVSLDRTSVELTEGDEITLNATVKPDNATNKRVTWSSSDESVAKVVDGKVSTLSPGEVIITVKTEDGSMIATCEVTVKAKVYPVEDVSLDRTSVELIEGDEITLNATVKPDNATNKRVTWSSSDESVAKVSDGKVVALAPGNAIITVNTKDGRKTATCEVVVTPRNRTDLSFSGTANCYIISESGAYKFTPTRGNSNKSVGVIESVEVLWETFGNGVKPKAGDLVKNVKLQDGSIVFETPSVFNEGNAVIAAKDAFGIILWSWHIWLTDQPEEQVYYNKAGTMMDRNLGATSAKPGDIGAHGLFYQWGRKDPFLGAAFNNSFSPSIAYSTITWPSAVSSNSSNGTISYATANPTTFIKYNRSNWDWYYTGDSSTDNTRWTTSKTAKSIYDPCPSGWRVPDGGENGVWAKAVDLSSRFKDETLYSETNKGMNFSGKFGDDNTIWYPASGCRRNYDGVLVDYRDLGHYWSASSSGNDNYGAFNLIFYSDGVVLPSNENSRAQCNSVRCVKEQY